MEMKNFISVNALEYDKAVSSNDVVVVDFWADWCMPCKMFLPVLEKLAQNNPNITVVKVNVDENEELSRKFEVRNIPTVLIYKQGELKQKLVGGRDYKELLELINNV